MFFLLFLPFIFSSCEIVLCLTLLLFPKSKGDKLINPSLASSKRLLMIARCFCHLLLMIYRLTNTDTSATCSFVHRLQRHPRSQWPNLLLKYRPFFTYLQTAFLKNTIGFRRLLTPQGCYGSHTLTLALEI